MQKTHTRNGVVGDGFRCNAKHETVFAFLSLDLSLVLSFSLSLAPNFIEYEIKIESGLHEGKFCHMH